MFAMRTLSRPLQRILAEWIGRLADRLLQFKHQLRYGFIELISSSVAETIEDNLHRPFERTEAYPEIEEDSWQHNYLKSEPSHNSYPSRPMRLAEPFFPSASRGRWEGWKGILSNGLQIVLQWLQGKWAEPILVSAITLISVLLLLR